MKNIFEAAWKAFEFEKFQEYVEIKKEKRDFFVNTCCQLYKDFGTQFMKKQTKASSHPQKWPELDRHKIAAIIAVVGSKDGLICSKQTIREDEFFIGRYTIPILVGLQFIMDDTNKDLANFSICVDQLPLKLYIPDTKVCTTKYIISLARRLYLEEKEDVDDVIRVLGLANVFFLMEECTLLKNNIPMDTWLKRKREQSKHSEEEGMLN